jgi:hypothetical protein
MSVDITPLAAARFAVCQGRCWWLEQQCLTVRLRGVRTTPSRGRAEGQGFADGGPPLTLGQITAGTRSGGRIMAGHPNVSLANKIPESQRPRAGRPDRAGMLTEREAEVPGYLGEGLSNAQ